jgi:hypothetical protein
VGHGTKTNFNAVSGIVGLQVAAQDMQRQMAAGHLTPQQVRARVCGRGGGGEEGRGRRGREARGRRGGWGAVKE